MPRTTENLLPAYTEVEIRSLLAAASTHRDQTLLLCLLDSGCRATELLVIPVPQSLHTGSNKLAVWM